MLTSENEILRLKCIKKYIQELGYLFLCMIYFDRVSSLRSATCVN